MEAEDLLISKLKIELGTQYVSKLVQMGVDIKNSRDLTESFHKMDHKGTISGIDMSIKLLTNGLWGEQKSASCKLPEEIKACATVFEKSFKQIYISKNITWVIGQGDCELKTLFGKKTYSLIVTLYQAAILSAFNKKDEYTFGELQLELGIPNPEFNVNIFPLMNPKLGKLLIKENLKTPKFTSEEKISLNLNFSYSNFKLQLIPIVHKSKVHLLLLLEIY